MTRFVEVFVISPLVFTVGFGGNHRNLTRLLQGNEDPLIGIEALVGEQDVGFELRQQGISPLQIARLSSGEMESSGVAESIDGCVDLGAQSALAASDGLLRAPFLRAPALY